MKETPAVQEALGDVLARFANQPLRDAAAAVLNALGYESNRTMNAGSVAEFLARYEAEDKLTERQRNLFESWQDVELVFQITDDEIGNVRGLLADGFDIERMSSFVFLAVELAGTAYSRTALADMTRAVNRLFAMPVVLIFRCQRRLSLAVIHRRAHRRDGNRDVLERVTLVKDVDAAKPHRAHLEILADLALPKMVDKRSVTSFDSLHRAWEEVLDTEELNRRFYRELFKWYERALETCKFPDDGAGSGSQERQLIRLITRLLFIWFLKEKRLVPEDIFTEEFAAKSVKGHARKATNYYRAVLQNLFFATLNTEIDKREFSKRQRRTHRDFTKYRYHDLLANPDGFLAKLKTVPFVNGGLFDCLDDFESRTAGGRRIDAFTDNIKTQGKDLQVPASILLGQEHGLFPLFRRFKFTVEENTPLDQEVALDPELLGRVFENLLAAYTPETRNTARKATGSYYTPRRIVDYMVDEVLVATLTERVASADGDKGWLEDRLRYLLDYEDACDDAVELFERADAERIVRAIASLRVLDPAVGSGAFPMGVLHKLTLILRRLDPENALWERLQREMAGARATAAFESRRQTDRDAKLLEISSTFETYRDSDFGRKLYLIQNGIYGVDIQPVACQIARLRFFISLTVEQEPNDDPTSNYGVRPLPNLETRIVAADALIGITAPKQMGFGEHAVREHIGRLHAVREMHFNAQGREDKLRLRKQDAKLRMALAKALESNGWGHEEAGQVAGWDPYGLSNPAKWFDPQWMFGVSDGFDVLIGNPPYIQLQRNSGELGQRYRQQPYETFASTGDIYQLFCERGLKLLAKGGHLAYITSNSWLKAKYGEKMRDYLSTAHTPRLLLEVGKDVFDNAIVDTSILLVQQGRDESLQRVPAVDVDSLADKQFPPAKSQFGSLYFGGKKPWVSLSPIERSIMDKMMEVGTPLKEWDISIYRGVLTGYNDAFIVPSEVRDRLIAEDPASEDVLKPILRGRDIRPYRAQWAGLWLVDTHNGFGTTPAVDVTAYPAIKRHLDLHWAAIAKRQDKGTTPYNLRNCAYHEDFEREKLCWMHMSPVARFSFVGGGVYCNQKAFMIVGDDLKYLCAVLNSTMVTRLVANTAVTTGMGLTQWDKFVVETVPVPHPSQARRNQLVRLIDILLSQASNLERVKAVDQIEGVVYDLYELDDSEKQFMATIPQRR